MVDIANLCLEADNKNEVNHSKYVVVKAINTITLLGKVNHYMTFGRKEISKNTLSKDYETIYEQDHSDSKQLLGDDLTANVKKSKATYSMNQSISDKRLRLSFSFSSNPKSHYSSSSKARSSITHSLNFQGHMKKFQRQQPNTKWNSKQQPQMKWN